MGFKRLAAAVMTGGGSEVARGLSKGYDKMTQGPQFNAPEIDPDVIALQKKQMQKAKDFRGGMEGMRKEQFGQAEEGARAGLARDMYANKANYANRGLLFSGMKQGGEADVQTESAANLAAKRGDINKNLEDTATGLEQQAFESGSRIAELNSQRAAMQMQFDQTAAENRNKGIGGFLRMGSKIAGGYGK